MLWRKNLIACRGEFAEKTFCVLLRIFRTRVLFHLNLDAGLLYLISSAIIRCFEVHLTFNLFEHVGEVNLGVIRTSILAAFFFSLLNSIRCSLQLNLTFHGLFSECFWYSVQVDQVGLARWQILGSDLLYLQNLWSYCFRWSSLNDAWHSWGNLCRKVNLYFFWSQLRQEVLTLLHVLPIVLLLVLRILRQLWVCCDHGRDRVLLKTLRLAHIIRGLLIRRSLLSGRIEGRGLRKLGTLGRGSHRRWHVSWPKCVLHDALWRLPRIISVIVKVRVVTCWMNGWFFIWILYRASD